MVSKLNRKTKSRLKIFAIVLLNAVIITFCSFASLAIRCGFMTDDFIKHAMTEVRCIVPDVGIGLIMISAFGLYSTVWRYAGIEDIVKTVKAAVAMEIVFVLYRTLLGILMPRSFYIIDLLLLLIFGTASRVSVRVVRSNIRRRNTLKSKRILGVVEEEKLPVFIRDFTLNNDDNLVYIVTFSPSMKGKSVLNIPVGVWTDIPQLVKTHAIDEIVIDIKDNNGEKLRELLSICSHTQARVRKATNQKGAELNSSHEEISYGKSIELNQERYKQLCDVLSGWGLDLSDKISVQGNQRIISLMTLAEPARQDDANKEHSNSQESNVVLPFEVEGEYYIESLKDLPEKPVYEAGKRLSDIISSGIALIILAVPMLIIALIIRRESHGGAIYSQERLGKNGKVFCVYKFRTMYIQAESTGAKWSQGDVDERITPNGRVLRKFRLDELPQLWNIFKGDMSLVGPRPERAVFYEAFEKYIHGFNERLRVKQGLTGLAQIRGGYNLRPEEKILHDVEYIKNRSLRLDLSILFKTVVTVFTHEGAK